MTALSDKDYIRKLRPMKREIVISLSQKFIKENNLQSGDYIDLRDLKKVVINNR